MRAGRRADRPALERPALQRLHARAPRAAGGRRLGLDDRPAALGGATRRRRAARADGHLRARGARPAALRHRRPRPRPHHRRRAAATCCACGDGVGFAIEAPLPVPPVFDARRPSSATSPTREMWEVFNMGCGFVARRARGAGRRGRCAARRPPSGRRAYRHRDRRRWPAVGAWPVALLAPAPQKISGHHGAASARKAADVRANAPGRSSATRPAAASSDSRVPPR